MTLPVLLLASALCVGSVHDGDTVRTCSGERVRLIGIDAPEVRGSPRCTAQSRKRLARSKNLPWCDFNTGIASRKALSTFLASGPVRLQRSSHDRYGRTLGKLSVRGNDAGSYLIARHLAREWR